MPSSAATFIPPREAWGRLNKRLAFWQIVLASALCWAAIGWAVWP